MGFEYCSTSGIVFVDISGKLDYLQVSKDFRWKWKIQADSDVLKRRQYSVIMNVEAQQSDDSQNNTRILRFSRFRHFLKFQSLSKHLFAQMFTQMLCFLISPKNEK
ncbi:unnamed protein product [Caenorhabditis angaria]|uniref:Uncharacterized protein n=1 Tax=Caenorhabditis angaria TaxID=860376 RepID=A0A9P1MV24_9PELO|nr:unnamed protein product [Caenorhabditis angaria]